MERVNILKIQFTTAIGLIGGIFIRLLGGWGEDMTTLLIFMGVDFALGLLIAAFWQKSSKSQSGALSSNSAWRGLIKKGAALAVVAVGHRLDVMLNMDYIRTAVIIAFCANELLSIVENLGIMGVPLPNIIKRAIELLQEKSDKEES